MIIQVDLEGRSVVEQLCDIALKEGGVKNLRAVNRILSSVKVLPPKEKPLPKSDPVTEEKAVESKIEKSKTEKTKKKIKQAVKKKK